MKHEKRSKACLKLGGLSHVGAGAGAAADRREHNTGFFERLREAYQVQHSGRLGARSG